MCFARIRTETTKVLDRVVSHRQSCRSVIDPHEINLIVSLGELVVGQGKVWIAFHRFVEQANSFKKAVSLRRVEYGTGDERLAAHVQIIGGKGSGWSFFDCRLFARRNFGLKLRNYFPGKL